MILECPECHTRYLVPDTAIGATGRTVRCANCRHSWYQEGSALVAPPEPLTAPVTEVAAASLPPSVVAPPPLVESAYGYDEGADAAPVRRNPARRWTAMALAAAALMIAAVGLIAWLGSPGLLQRAGLFGGTETPLRLVDNPIERRELANGSELFAVSGKILNPSASRQRVPDIRADLRDAQGRLVFSWTITPAQRTLGPRGQLDFNSATLDVPATSKRLELSFAGEAAS